MTRTERRDGEGTSVLVVTCTLGFLVLRKIRFESERTVAFLAGVLPVLDMRLHMCAQI